MDFGVSANHREKIKENEKRDKHLNVARELKKKKKTMEHAGDNDTNCNCCAQNNPQRLDMEELEIGGQAMIIQTTAMLKSARTLRRVLETWRDLLSFRLQWKTIS